MRAAMLSVAALVALAACDPVGVARQAPDCVRLLQNYDRAEAAFGNSGSRDRLVLPPAIEQTAQRARQGGCVTRIEQLALVHAFADAVELGGPSGPPIQRVWLQAGVVAGVSSELQARELFGSVGLPVRSRGAPGLGRRIFIGPFDTEGGLAEGMEVARRAGFVAPYVRRF